MKTSIIALFYLAVTGLESLGKDQAVTPAKNEIIYHVTNQASYLDPEEVILDYLIENRSKLTMIVVSHGLDRIKLYGPDGELVRPYPYRSSGMGSRMYVINCYPPDGRCTGSLCLSALFPFPIQGEYRCTLTRRIYLWNSTEIPDTQALIDNDYYGTPFEVTAKEIKFRVEAPTSKARKSPQVDPSNGLFEPGFEYDPMVSKKHPVRGEGHYKQVLQETSKTEAPSIPVTPTEPSPTQTRTTKKAPEVKLTPTITSQEADLATPWSVIMILVVLAGGLLWFLSKKRN